MAIQFKRGTKAKREASSLVLEAGQPLFETDTNKLYIGDGTTAAGNLESITDAVPYHIRLTTSSNGSANFLTQEQVSRLMQDDASYIINKDGLIYTKYFAPSDDSSSLYYRRFDHNELAIITLKIIKATGLVMEGYDRREFSTLYIHCIYIASGTVSINDTTVSGNLCLTLPSSTQEKLTTIEDLYKAMYTTYPAHRLSCSGQFGSYLVKDIVAWYNPSVTTQPFLNFVNLRTPTENADNTQLLSGTLTDKVISCASF